MKNKVETFGRKYGIIIAVIIVVLFIIGYFAKIIVFDNKKDVLTVLVLSDNLDVEVMENDLYQILDIGEKEEVVIKYMNSTVETEQAIILTWIRSRTVDVVIGEKQSLEFYAQNGALMNLQEVGFEMDERAYIDAVNVYSSDGKLIGKGEEILYGKYAEKINGLSEMRNPIVSLTVNGLHRDEAILALNYYLGTK